MSIVLRVNQKNRAENLSHNKWFNANEICWKNSFARLNDKCFYFHDEIVFLPFGHFLLNKAREENEKHQADLYTKI